MSFGSPRILKRATLEDSLDDSEETQFGESGHPARESFSDPLAALGLDAAQIRPARMRAGIIRRSQRNLDGRFLGAFMD